MAKTKSTANTKRATKYGIGITDAIGCAEKFLNGGLPLFEIRSAQRVTLGWRIEFALSKTPLDAVDGEVFVSLSGTTSRSE